MTEPLRIGIVGAGATVDAIHAPGYRACPDAELVGIASRTPERAESLARKFEIPDAFPDIDDLLGADHIDAVSICTPPNTHREFTERAVETGKHVLLEKPVAHSLEDVGALRRLAGSAETVVEVVRNERFMELHEAAKAVVDSGELGDITNLVVLTTTTGPDDWTGGAEWPKDRSQAGGGALIDLGVHKVDLITWLIGEEVVDVGPAVLHAPGGSGHGDVEWSGAAVLTLAAGAVATVSASWLGPPDATLTALAGSEGLLLANGATGELSLTLPTGTSRSQHVSPWDENDRSNLAMIRDFVEICRRGRRLEGFPLANWDAGTRWVLEAYDRRLN